MQCIHKNENVGPDKNEFERKSLVPRIVYLSMQAASPTPKENKETINGGASSATIADELGSLLERYARSIGFSFNDAIDAILSITTGENSFKVSLPHKTIKLGIHLCSFFFKTIKLVDYQS